ncbi:MAG: NADP-dependent glyceraldehyde-3-phosphate dehydrogenase [Planctomycetota bacterium]|nr:NADP-dependent glyceraldehyde-3-phosphate dehydrogenase [Planctomycetota bacterium]
MASPDKLAALFPEESAVSPQFRMPGRIDQREYLVDGEERVWNGPTREVLSPVCLTTPRGIEQQKIGSYPLLDEKEALAALAAAVRAYDNGRGRWPTMAVADRIRHVEDFLFRIKDKRGDVVRLLMWEIGKSLKDSEKEFDRTIEYVRDTIDALKDLDRASSRFTIQQGIIGQIRRAPLGVVLCMGPFNYPLNETFTTLIPALIMGNTVIFKPPKLGVLLHRPLLEAFRDSFPRGVVNTVYGEGQTIVPPLMSSGQINVLAFIGTARVANTIRKQHPKPHRMRCVLGLDAKNAAIVLPDADLDLAVRECVLGALSFNGQRCTALKMLFVHTSVAADFLRRLSGAVAQLKPGMPWDDGVNITPLPEPGKPARMAEYVADAQREGAAVVNESGGAASHTFFYPAVLYPVNARMRLWREEQFGPVIPVAPFDDIAEPVRYVEESDYGQQVSIFGTDPEHIARLVDPLVNQVCRVNINSQCQRGPDTFPFAGRKDSAEGTLSVSDALRVFAIRTLVAAKAEEVNKKLITHIVRNHTSNFLSTDFIF